MLTPPISNSEQLSGALELSPLYLEVSGLQPSAEAVWANHASGGFPVSIKLCHAVASWRIICCFLRLVWLWPPGHLTGAQGWGGQHRFL